jgi:hypothetical protein
MTNLVKVSVKNGSPLLDSKFVETNIKGRWSSSGNDIDWL